VGIGQSLLENSSLLAMPISLLHPNGRCDHTLHIMGRADLARSWSYQRTILRRPVTLRVIPHNETFYPALCARQGFGVLFTVEDELGSLQTDLSDAKGTLTVLDSTGEHTLFSMGCTRLPSRLADPVPVGTCYTSYCPNTQVMVRVAVSWNGGSVRGSTLLAPGPSSGCGSTSAWVVSVELVTPSVPYFPGETIRLYIRVLNSPAHLAVFKFALRMLPSVEFVSFQSVYSTVFSVEQDVVSVVGDSSQGAGTTLGVLALRIRTSTGAGARLAVQMVQGSCQITLPDTVPYTMMVRTHGFSCRTDGFLQVLVDTARVTSLIARPRRAALVHWRRIQPWSGLSVSTAIDTMAVRNTMRGYGLVATADCTSLHPSDLLASSCASIQATGSGLGNPAASVRVHFMTASVLVNITVYVPQNQTVWTARSGLFGRFKVLVHLQAGPALVIRDVDATPYVAPGVRASGPVSVRNEQWTCASLSAASFTVGDPILFTGTCDGDARVPTSPATVYLFTGGEPGMGRFMLSRSELSSASNTGVILLLAGPLGLPQAWQSVSTSASPERVSLTADGGLSLVRSGASARCILVEFGGMSSTGAMIPVYPPSPVLLQVSLSATTLVSINETFTGLLPLSTSVTLAMLIFSDGSALNVRGDPRFQMALGGGGSSLLNVTGQVASAGPSAGNATLVFRILGMPCVTTSIGVRVLPFAVQSSVLVCPLCPNVLTTTADPLGMQFPTAYPSSIPESLFVVRRLLTDGTVLRRFEPLSVSGGGVLVNGRVLALSQGDAVITTNSTGEAFRLPILNRWAVSWRLLCNQRLVCSEEMKLAPPGDGAGMTPFSYATSLSLSLSLTLANGSTANFSWLAGVAVTSNQTELTNTGAKEVPLYYGMLAVRAFFDERWQIQAPVRTLNFRVERLAAILITGPSVLYQMHCSLMWEEGLYNTSGVLTDGFERTVQAQLTTTDPLVLHQHTRVHADRVGTGQITAVFGLHSGSMWVQATLSSKYFVSVGLDFIPSQWSTTLDQPLPAQAQLSPSFWQGEYPAWSGPANLTSRVLQWTSSAPDVILAQPDSLQLLMDHYQPVTVTATLLACGDGPGFSISKDVVVNVVPSTAGQIDYGQDHGVPVMPVAPGQLMAIPIFIFAPTRLRSYILEIQLDEAAFESVDCTVGELPASECATRQDGPVVFRAAGAMLHSQLTGRLLVSTVTCRPLVDTVGGVRVRVLQSVMGEQVLDGSREYQFSIRLGSGPLPAGYQPASFTGLTPPVEQQSEAYGDTDGDGFFTGLDVLFMEHYSTVAMFAGEQQVCTVQGRCQLKTQLTAWQLMQLKPVRNPNVPATRPDGSDLLFLLRALVGKAYFLTSLDIRSRPGTLSVSLSLRDHLQQVNPSNAAVQIELFTSANQDLAFDSPSAYDVPTSVLTVECRREGPSFVLSSLRTAVTSDESLVAMRVVTRALDRFGSQESASSLDRRFSFLPDRPLASFNVLASTDSLLLETPRVDYIPTLNCQTLCEDASLFLDGTLGLPEWPNSTAVTASFALYPPLFGGLWPGALDLLGDGWTPAPDRHLLSIPANIPAPDAILVGTRFNLTFEAPPGLIMAVFQVESASATLVRVCNNGAEARGNTFFMHPARFPVALLELTLDRAGTNLPIRIFVLNALPFEALPANTLAHTALVTGYVPAITSLRVEILCQAGVILWSVLGGTDEPCDVLITPLWTPAATTPGVRVTCQTYPCIVQGFSQTVRPSIQTYTPTNPRVLVQRSLISLGQRVQWRAVCDLVGGAIANLTVTQRALAAGVIRLSPPNALAITRDTIRGTRLGQAVVRFGNRQINASVGINVTSAVIAPRSLVGVAFSGIRSVISPSSKTITATFQTGSLVPGQRGYILVRAVYSGGYSLLLDPIPSPISGGMSVLSASQYVTPSQIDGSFYLRRDTPDGLDQPIVTVQFQGVSLTIRADVVSPRPMAAPAIIAPPVAASTTPSSGTIAAAPTLDNVTVRPDIEIVRTGQGGLQLSLLGQGVTGFYIQLQVDGIRSCTPGQGLPLLSDCAVDPILRRVMLAGAAIAPVANRTELASLEFDGPFAGVWGFLEVHALGLPTIRYPVTTTGVAPPVEHRMPTVDATLLNRRYNELLLVSATPPQPHTRSPLYKALFVLYMLTGRQRNVDARLYSNAFELSAMFRVMDRFLEPDTNGSHTLIVTFHTEALPPLPNSILVPGVGLQVPASHVLDGWYVVEWRQQIPVIPGLVVSFTLQTSTMRYAWPWEVSDSLRTGLALPSCPRAATDIGTFLMTYQITAPVELPSTLLVQIACSVQVAGRRVLLGPPDQSTGARTLSIGLESLARVHQANLVVMGDWLAEQLPGIVVQRKQLSYINDTRDPPIPCPEGSYFTQNGSYQPLPMHALAGPDCYDLHCVGGYTLAPETRQCIPMPVSTDLVWVCVLVVNTLVLAVSGVIFCVQLAAYWRTPVQAVVFDPATVSGEPPACSAADTGVDNPDDLSLQYHHIVTGVVLDDYSVMMLDDEDFSPVPLDKDY
jgi:hypothetical protein